jgi:hypothetical protein
MFLPPTGIRWTIGDVDPLGFEALRLSIWGAWRIFGTQGAYVVYVNSVGIGEAQARTGHLPEGIVWRSAGDLPGFLQVHLDGAMAEGVAWKLAPLRAFPDRYELSLDNDCILWDLSDTMCTWLTEAEPRCLIAADVKLAHGAFTDLTRPEPRNAGIRGLPPGYDLGQALLCILEKHPVPLKSELDEQGLQVVALDLGRPAYVVSTTDVTICSPFWPQSPELGRVGAHFVGLNARNLPWNWYDRPAKECVIENWNRHRPELYARVGLSLSS